MCVSEQERNTERGSVKHAHTCTCTPAHVHSTSADLMIWSVTAHGKKCITNDHKEAFMNVFC